MPNIEDLNFSLSADMVKIIWNLSPIVIAIIDEEGNFLHVNNTAQYFLEYTEEELRMKKWQEITHPEDLRADVNMHRILRDNHEKHFTMHKRYITKSGRIVWGSLTVHALKNSDGKFLYFLSQIIPLDNYVNEGNRNNQAIAPVSSSTAAVDRGRMGKFIMSNLTNVISIVLVIIGGIYVFSSDIGADKQRIRNLESDIGKMERKMDETSRKMEDMMKILMEIRTKHQGSTP